MAFKTCSSAFLRVEIMLTKMLPVSFLPLESSTSAFFFFFFFQTSGTFFNCYSLSKIIKFILAITSASSFSTFGYALPGLIDLGMSKRVKQSLTFFLSCGYCFTGKPKDKPCMWNFSHSMLWIPHLFPYSLSLDLLSDCLHSVLYSTSVQIGTVTHAQSAHEILQFYYLTSKIFAVMWPMLSGHQVS